MLLRRVNKIFFFIGLLILILPISATATTYIIDPQASFLHYDPWPPNYQGGIFSISGSFTLVYDNTFRYFDDTQYIPRVRLETVNIQTPPLPEGSFNLPDYFVTINGSSFSGNGNPCNYFGPYGTCWSTGNFGYYEGILKGDDIELEGEAPYGFYWWQSYDFTIKATAVPEPTTVLLFGLGMIGLAAVRRRLKN